MQIKYNERDWSLLVAMTSELANEFGGRPAAFKEACRLRPDLNATPPGGMPPARPQIRIESPVRAALMQIEQARAPRSEAVGDIGGAVGNAPDGNPSQSAVVKACEALAAARERRPDLTARPPGAVASAVGNAPDGNPSQSAVVKACEALAAARERRPDLTARPPGAVASAVGNAPDGNPSQSAVVKACEALAASSNQGRAKRPPV